MDLCSEKVGGGLSRYFVDMVVCDVVFFFFFFFFCICRRCSGSVLAMVDWALQCHGRRQQWTMACGSGGKRLVSVMNRMLES